MFIPKLVFVDGPNACGKDYFIENFITQYKQENPDCKIQTVELKSFIDKELIKGNKTYDYFITNREDYCGICDSHINALTYLNQIAGNESLDTIVVNRSFSSFVIYNMLMPQTCMCGEDSEICNTDLKIFIKRYNDVFNTYFFKTPTLFVNLTPTDKPIEELHQTYLNRIESRKSGLQVNQEYVKSLISKYMTVANDIVKAYSFKEQIDSSGSSYIMKKYSF